MVTVSKVFMWISILTVCGTLISFSTAVGVTGVCREDVFTKFTNFTVTAESIDFTLSNVAYCKRQCRDVGCDQMFSFDVGSEMCRCFTWPVILEDAVDAVPIYISSNLIRIHYMFRLRTNRVWGGEGW